MTPSPIENTTCRNILASRLVGGSMALETLMATERLRANVSVAMPRAVPEKLPLVTSRALAGETVMRPALRALALTVTALPWNVHRACQ